MHSVLGIDAAWTMTQPSGVALAVEGPSGWRLLAVESSYQRFQALADTDLEAEQHPSGSRPDVPALLASAVRIANGPINIVAVDMPLARTPIERRRPSDNAVSKHYGARKCGTHTPNALRPGPISEDLSKSFDLAGYPLLTDIMEARGLIEVYPHPALVELAGAAIRLPYKASKTRSYWPYAAPAERRLQLYQQWNEIVALLEGEMSGVADRLPIPELTASRRELKAYEDRLDAIVCAWVAICALEGRATPFGDENSAIWIPIQPEGPANN